MRHELLNNSVVVLADEHNPTILHPSFLRSQGIVPADWEPAEPPVCTPPFSIVKYPGGIVFTAESKKLQVMDTEPPEDLSRSEVSRLATGYIRTLPHVRYTAVGVNFAGFVECPDPERLLVERFLKSGPWNEGELALQSLGLRFAYPVSPGILHLSCDPGDIRRVDEGASRRGILTSGNYHLDLGEVSPLDEAVNAMGRLPERAQHFAQAVGRILGLGA